MSIHKTGLGRAVLAGASLLAFSCFPAVAQTPAAQSGTEQKGRVPARVIDTVDDTNRTVLRGNVHPSARAEFDLGAVPDAQPVTRIVLVLQRSAEQEAALRQLMEEQQSKNSPNYHAWLTPEQFGKQFGPADADVQAVTSWLTSHGFQNIKVAKGKTVVEFSGDAGQVRTAFGTEIHKFNVKGEEHFANVSDPQIPAALAPVVRGIRSLHNFHPKAQARQLGSFRRTENGEIRPLFTYTDSNGQFFGVGPADFATIYSVPAAMTGAGVSIAIVGQSNINLQDVLDFRSMFGLPAYISTCTGVPNQCPLTVILNGPDPGTGVDNGNFGDEGESDLDVEWAGAVAPAATINFVATQTGQTDGTAGIDGSALYIVDNNIAPILSESYGSCEAGLGTGGNAFYNALWQQAAAQGITVVISAGDNGSAGCDPAAAPANQDAATLGLGVSGIASTPYNIAMGGTDFDDVGNQSKFWNTTNSSTATPPAIPATAKGYIPEKTWNDSCASSGSTSACTSTIINNNSSTGIDLVAASGGQSSIYSKPSWQAGFPATADTTRDIPDVSLFASDNGAVSGGSNSFYIICQSDQDPTGGTGCNLTTTASSANHDFQAVGGTSAATPTFAAIMALVNQQTGQRQGVANYVLYSLASTASNVCNSSALTTAQLTSNTCVFYDTTKGNNSVACTGGSPNCSNTTSGQFGIMATTKGGTTPAFNAAAGYDLATGLGTVNVTNLLAKWASPSRTASVTTLNLSSTSITVDSSVTVSGTVTPATATGLVVLRDVATGAEIQPSCPTSAPLCTANAVSAGAYNFSTAFLPGGSYNVVAHYGGDGTFAASDSASIPVTVAKQNSQTVVNFVTATGALTTAAQNVTYGSSYIVRIDVELLPTTGPAQMCQNLGNTTTFVAPLSFTCPTGAVTLTDNGKVLNDFPNAQTPNAANVANLNERGFAEDQLIELPVGSHSIAASYPGDGSYNPSSSNSLSVTITQATTSIAVTASPTSIASGGNVTLTATVSTPSKGEAPCGSGVAGTVQFKNGSTAISGTVNYTGTSGILSSSGQASCTATLVASLSEFVPVATPRSRPQVPVLPLASVSVLLILFLAMQRRLSIGKRIGYAAAGLILFASTAAGITGCSGSSNGGGGGGGSHTDSITAVYSGDANYTGSTSSATPVTIQ
jgi:subtilase family serine protease